MRKKNQGEENGAGRDIGLEKTSSGQESRPMNVHFVGEIPEDQEETSRQNNAGMSIQCE